MDVDSALTAAMRRRQRRLRQFLRHERLSVAMALAEKLHHTSRGQRFARAGEEGREEHDALRRQRPPPPQPELFQLYDEEPGGSRPACLVAPRGPQEVGRSWVFGRVWGGGPLAGDRRAGAGRAGPRTSVLFCTASFYNSSVKIHCSKMQSHIDKALQFLHCKTQFSRQCKNCNSSVKIAMLFLTCKNYTSRKHTFSSIVKIAIPVKNCTASFDVWACVHY